MACQGFSEVPTPKVKLKRQKVKNYSKQFNPEEYPCHYFYNNICVSSRLICNSVRKHYYDQPCQPGHSFLLTTAPFSDDVAIVIS